MLWQDLYQSCISESDPKQLERLVSDLEDAIVVRWRELSSNPDCDEAWALKEAARKLLDLKTQKLGWSDPAKVADA